MKKLFFVSFLALAGLIAQAQTFLTPNYVTNLTLPATINHNGYSNVTLGTFPSNSVTIYPGHAIGLGFAYTNAVTTSTSNILFYINLTQDGSNWMATPPYTVQYATVAGTTNLWSTNLPALWFDGYMAMRIEAWTNSDNANAITPFRLTLSRQRLDLRP